MFVKNLTFVSYYSVIKVLLLQAVGRGFEPPSFRLTADSFTVKLPYNEII